MKERISFFCFLLLVAGAIVFILPLDAIVDPAFLPISQAFVAVAGFAGLVFMLTTNSALRRDPILWGIIFVLITYSLLEFTGLIQ